MKFAKVFTDILGDPKLMRASRKGASALDLLPWLIVFAKLADDDGRLTVNGEPAEPVDISDLVPCVTAKRIATCIRESTELGILIKDETVPNAYRFATWDLRAGMKPSDSKTAIAERVARHRAKKRLERNGVAVEGETTDGNALQGVSGNATEKEVEVEEEVEEEVEVELHGTSGDVPAPSDDTDDATYPADFEAAWAAYPRRGGGNPKRAAFKAWQARRRGGVSAAELLAGVQRYAAFCTATGKVGTETVMQARTFFGPDERWSELYETPTAAGAIASNATPVMLRARELHSLAREFELFTFNGNQDEYTQRVVRAAADPRAGTTFKADARNARMWDGIGTIPNERFAVEEIARRLDAKGWKVAS